MSYMPLSRVTSSDTQVSINDSRLKGVTNLSIEQSRETSSLRGLSYLNIQQKVAQLTPENKISLEWMLGNGTTDPFFDISSSELISSEAFELKIRDLAGSYLFSNSFLTSYGVSANVGELINGTVEYISDYLTIGEDALTPFDQVEDSFSVFVPKSIIINQTNAEAGTIISCPVQSFSINVPISRKKIVRVGQRQARTFYPEFPIEASLSFSIIKTDVVGVEDYGILPFGSFEIKLSDCSNLGEKTYTLEKCWLDSISESVDLEGNNVINVEYSVAIGGQFYSQANLNQILYNNSQLVYNGVAILFS